MIIDKVVTFDLETTGFSFSRDKIIEIGAVAYYPKTGNTGYFNRFIKVDSIPAKITELTGINLAKIEKYGGLPIEQTLPLFSDFIFEGSTRVLLVGHNIMRFDCNFFKQQHKAFWTPVLRKVVIWDTLIKERLLIASEGSKTSPKSNLIACCQRYKIDVPGPSHRALVDAKKTFELFKKQHAKRRFRTTLAKRV